MAGPPPDEDETSHPPNGTNGSTAQTHNGNETISTTTDTNLSADEIALYDRQLRLWGAEAQKRIRSANILLISLRALGTEIAKNLVLAGINSLTIIDDGVVEEEDLGCGFFLREEDVGKSRAESAIPRIQDLNPRVTISASGGLSTLLQQDQTYYAPFDCIIACDADFFSLSLINTAARVASRPFYAAGIHGFYGFIFADLFGHEFVVERQKSNVPTNLGPETITRSVLSVSRKEGGGDAGKDVEVVKKQEIYCPLILANSSPLPPDILASRRKLKSVPPLLPCLRALFDFQRMHSRLPSHDQQDLRTFTSLATTKSRELQLPQETLNAEFLRSFLQCLGAEIPPTAAFIGGRLSEDVINVLGRREQPIQNFALFDGDALEGRIYCLYSPPPELAMQMGMQGMDMGAGMVDGFMGQDMGGAEMGMGMEMMQPQQQMELGAGQAMDGGANATEGGGENAVAN